MEGKPELIIGYDAASLPVEGVCSVCGESMMEGYEPDSPAPDRIRWYVTMFRVHLREKHSDSPSIAD
jgi:hypothetical protein